MAAHHAHMQVIHAAGPRRRASAVAVASRFLVGLVVLAAAAGSTVVIATSGMLDELGRLGSSRLEQQLIGTLGWALAFLVPGTIAVLGLATIWRAVDRLPRRRRTRPVAAMAEQMSDDYVVVEDVRLPDGRDVAEIVVGPHGLTVVEELPPARVSRPGSHHWEVRAAGGRWLTIENPLDRAARDGERLRRWLGAHFEDFLPRITVAVVADDERVSRTAEVAVLSAAQLPRFFAAQPVVRQMSADRRARIEALLRELLTA
jgi:hypothetical protein